MREPQRRAGRLLPRERGKATITPFGRGARGATAIEYGLIAALVAVVIITGLTALGSALNTKFESVASEVESADTGTGSGAPAPTDTPTPTTVPSSTPVPSATATLAESAELAAGATETTAAPIEINFNADSYSIERGECTTLRWQVTNAEVVRVLGREVESLEAEEVCPRETTSYTLVATGVDEELTEHLEIEVTDPERDRGCYTDPNGALICP